MFKRNNERKVKEVRQQTNDAIHTGNILKNKKVMIYLSILFVMVLFGIVVYSEKVSPIGVIENVKRALGELVQSSNFDGQNQITKVDVTGILPGEETDHEHLYKTMYDENKHWEECMACGKKRNENIHSYKRTWSLGKENCQNNNYYTDTCTCGYSKIGFRPCVFNGKYAGSQCSHTKVCNICNEYIQRGYYVGYYGNGNVLVDLAENCVDAYGNRITCQNAGTCVFCKHVYTAGEHMIKVTEDGIIFCAICKQEYGKIATQIEYDNSVPTQCTVIDNVTLKNGATFYNKGGMRYASEPWQNWFQNIINGKIGETNFTLNTIGIFKDNVKTPYVSYTWFTISIDDKLLRVESSLINLYPDKKLPEIANIVTDNEELLTTWSRTKPIIISGTENYCDTVKVEIIDEEGSTFFTGNTVVTNGSYTISCTPELEVDASGKRFKAIVTDACNNKTEQEFEIARVDAIAPRITSGDELGGDWAKSKKIIFSANDYGIGEVQIGFNSSDDYILASKDGQSYSREYELFGDVYEPREANVYYRDGLGNISTKKIIIDKLDNTVPTITNVNVHNNKLTVEANDINEIWGEGSGVVKYRYLSSDEKIGNIDESILINEVGIEENIVIPNLPEVKYVYVVAEDLVRKHKQNI